ncbi:MAG: phi13 family phage major tail protein [Lachnospiraceae bacterium]|jgi:phi13 family phage major tail protein|nr:phi13 family phage major tail protein [Lachnospiraceae bacterium]
MSASVKANRFNVSRIVYSVISKDDETAYNYGPIKKFGDPMTVQLTPSYASGKLYGGGVVTEDHTKITGIALKVDVNKVPIEVRAEIGGHDYTDGVLTTNKKDQPKEIAIGYEVEQTGDNVEVVWLLKGKAKPFGNSVQQTTDNINYSTDSIDIGFMPTVFTGDIKKDGDTANEAFTAVVAAAFLDTIPGGTLVGV